LIRAKGGPMMLRDHVYALSAFEVLIMRTKPHPHVKRELPIGRSASYLFKKLNLDIEPVWVLLKHRG
jgi:hypothetical protein